MSAFERDERARVACNLCRVVGDTYEIDAAEDWLLDMEVHTALRHPEHVAALARGEKYEPVEVAP